MLFMNKLFVVILIFIGNIVSFSVYADSCKIINTYYVDGKVLKIPENGFLNTHPYPPPGFDCNDQTYINKQGTCCIPLPKYAIKTGSGRDFYCQSGYKKNGLECKRSSHKGYWDDNFASTSIPKNAIASGSGWICKNYFIKVGNTCQRIPANSTKYSNSEFKCKSGFRKMGNSCIKEKTIPPNAYASNSSQGWKCLSGYKQSGNSCIKEITIPPNAYASGSGWKCNPGYEIKGNSCIEDNTIYQAGSGSGFAATQEGHILTNHHVIDGCSEVLLFKNGKSYITTLVTQDPNNDLAILQSDYKASKVYSLSNEVYLSDDIFAAGFPFGRKISSAITINKGIISALMGPGDDISIFQIDADINSGNSGGPIVDRRGNAVGIAVSKLNAERAQEELKLGSTPEGFNFAVNSMMAIGLFRSQGIELPPQNDNELSVKERNDLFNQGTFYLSCGMTIAQYEKMFETDKVMFTRDVFFSNFE
jgi:S1-C subfamily serine protease